MKLEDIIELITFDGVIEGIGTAVGIGMLVGLIFNGVLIPLFDALIGGIC